MKRMKRLLTTLLAVLFMLCMSVSLVGCTNEMRTSSDGTFIFFQLGDNQFYRGDKKDTYAIVDTCEE